MRRPPRPGEGNDGAVPIEMPKGSVVYFTQGVWHRQGDRTEPGDRVTLHAHFNRGILRSLEPKKTDVQMLHRNSPRLCEMLGEDDWFDKLSAQGREPGGKRLRERETRNLETPQATARVTAEVAEEAQSSQRARELCVLRAF